MCSHGSMDCAPDSTLYEEYFKARGTRLIALQYWLTLPTAPADGLAAFSGFEAKKKRLERDLQDAMMPVIEAVVATTAIPHHAVDTSESPIRSLNGKKPDVCIATQDFISDQAGTEFVPKIVSFIQFKAGDKDFTDADVGQCVSYGDNLMERVPHRNVVFVGLANETTWCIVRVPRRDLSQPAVVPECGPRMQYNKGAAWPFQALICAPFDTLGFSYPNVPAGWVVGEPLGAGATSSVYKLTDPDGVTYAMKLVSADVVENEVFMTELAHQRCPNGVCKVKRVDGMPPYVIVLGPVVKKLSEEEPMSRDHLLRLAGILDAIATPDESFGPIVHRDVRRENLGLELAGDGMRLLDFGFSVFAGESKRRRGPLSFESDAILQSVIDGHVSVAATARDDHESFAKFGMVLGAKFSTGVSLASLLRATRRDEFGAPRNNDASIATAVSVFWRQPAWLTLKAVLATA
eukprot:c25805_g1_i1.p1 GENE.c25805_g1_i1~~c25805_g1_i1.p1  ORF type:complete len:510 (-),score=70.21 c25805_g1_i1:7-1392(-)